MDYIEEDWERLSEMDKMYLYEKDCQIWEEYQQYIEEEERKKLLPAKIVIRKVEEHDRQRQETHR